jgi:inorganic pyrophosphatase
MAMKPTSSSLTPRSIPPLDASSRLTHVIVDTPRGSRYKYKFDEDYKVLRLSRILPLGMSFPYDFGWIPGTRAEDGDPLDVLILTEAALFPGCLLTVRLIGVLRAHQIERSKAIRNDRLIAVLETPVNHAEVTRLDAIPGPRLQEIEEFFVTYNALQGRRFKVSGRAGPKAAQQIVRRGIDLLSERR